MAQLAYVEPAQGAALCFELAEASVLPLLHHAPQPREAPLSGITQPPHHRGVFPWLLAKPQASPGPRGSADGPARSQKQQRGHQGGQGRGLSPAQQLERGLEPITAPADLREAVLPPPGQAPLERPSMVLRIGSMLQPQGDTQTDRTMPERVLNVLTSLPFAALGLHMLRQRESAQGRRHAASLVAVGAVASIYHASYGGIRDVARKLDYWTIAVSASEMVKALYPGSSWARRYATASLLAVPFRPFWVSSAHAAVMEFEFMRQARKHKTLRRGLGLHVSTAAIGTAAFFLEDAVKEYGFEHMHGIWHCLSCYGMATVNGLLAHKERRHLAGQKPKLQTHCSASSLADLQHYGSLGKGRK